MSKIFAPFTPEQVESLNEYQNLGFVHEFTCGNDHEDDRSLVAKEDGWHCPSCDYTQNWAHDFMADAEKIRVLKAGAIAMGIKLKDQ